MRDSGTLCSVVPSTYSISYPPFTPGDLNRILPFHHTPLKSISTTTFFRRWSGRGPVWFARRGRLVGGVGDLVVVRRRRFLVCVGDGVLRVSVHYHHHHHKHKHQHKHNNNHFPGARGWWCVGLVVRLVVLVTVVTVTATGGRGLWLGSSPAYKTWWLGPAATFPDVWVMVY